MNKLIGGILLIIGTSIGAGMLALPIATAKATLMSNVLLMILCWAAMNLGALFILEANSWCKAGSNLISMARKTLGLPGELITWAVYLMLLYALLCAYIEGGTQITQHWLETLHLAHGNNFAATIFAIVMGAVVFKGIYWVDVVNRGLMSTKFILLFLLVLVIAPMIQPGLYHEHLVHNPLSATTVVITSFGFATIVPSLRSYFDGDIKKLRLAILIGSSVPLAIYLVWLIAVQGVIPIAGNNGLLAMQTSENATSQLAAALSVLSHSRVINIAAHIFTSICVLTSFLGVALSLSDFLADGTKIPKTTVMNKSINMLMTFLPPLAVVMLDPNLFIDMLNYAGILCVVLLMLLPALMVWRGRYHYKFSVSGDSVVMGGKLTVVGFVLLSCAVIALSIYYM